MTTQPPNDEQMPMQLGPFPLQWLLRNEGWQAVMIPGLTFPLASDTIHALRQVLDAFDAEVTKGAGVLAETLLQFSQLHVGGCSGLMTDRAQTWQPRMGLGIFPDQPPPELWTARDFEVMPGAEMKIRPLMNTVLRVASDKNVQKEVVRECLIGGGVLSFYTADFRDFLRKSKENLLPGLRGSSFQGFLFYLPLLNAASFQDTSDEELDRWLPGIAAYVAECPDERALVLALRGDLPVLLRMLQERLLREMETGQLL